MRLLLVRSHLLEKLIWGFAVNCSEQGHFYFYLCRYVFYLKNLPLVKHFHGGAKGKGQTVLAEVMLELNLDSHLSEGQRLAR